MQGEIRSFLQGDGTWREDLWNGSAGDHVHGGAQKNMACRTRHGAGVRGSAQRPHVALRPARCGGLRQQIVAVLRELPEGLSPKAVQTLLQSDKGVRSKGTVHCGLLTRLAAGRYVVAWQVPPRIGIANAILPSRRRWRNLR
jgi:hypothetical protein